MIEVTEIMRQKDDHHFIELLNRLRTGLQTEKDMNCINSQSISHWLKISIKCTSHVDRK